MANVIDDEKNGSEIYGNAEDIAKSGTDTAKETLKEELAPDRKNIVETKPAEETAKEAPPPVPSNRTYDAKEIQGMFSRGEDYSDSERNSMSEAQYKTYQNEAAKYLDTHDTLGGPEVESKRGKALDKEAHQLAYKSRFVAEESEDPEYAEYNAKFKRYDDVLTRNGNKWKDLSEEERDALRKEINEAYDYAEKQRGHARVFWDALQRGIGGVPTMMYQGVQTVFGGDDATDKIRESQREQELDDILNPKRSSSYSNIKSFGDFVDWASEGLGENVPRMIPGIAASVAGGAIASAATLNPVAGVMVGGALGGMFLNIGEGAQDQLAEEDLNRQYGNGRFEVSRGAAAIQGVGYSAMEGALGVVPGFGKVISGAFGRLAAKEAAKGFVKEATETGAKATLKGLGKALVKNALEEGVEEVSQSGVVAPIRRLFQTGSALKDGQRFYGQDPVSGMESFLHEELDEFLGGAVVGGLMGGASSAVDTADARKRVNAHSYVARLGGILDGDPEFAKFDNKSKMLVGRMIFNDAMQTTTNLISQDRKNELNAENGEINAELRRMAESGTEAEKLQAQSVSAYVNMLEGRFALEDYAKAVEEAKGIGITSDAFAKGREVGTTTVSVGENGDYADVSTDVESGVQKWHLFDKDGKELGWATGNASDRKAPIIDAKDLVLKTEEEADEQARNTDIFNQYRTGKNGPKAAMIRSIFEKMYGNRGIELEVVDRLDPIGANMRVGKNPAMFTPNGMKVYVAADQVKSLGQLYTLLGHEKLHADIADYILKAARVSGANGIFTNTKKGKSYQVIKADGAVDINALNAAQDEMLANTLGAEAMTQLAREKNPKSDWAISEGRTGQEMMAERKSVEDLRMQLLRGKRGVFGSVLEKVQRAIGMKMALDMGISAESITANDVMDEVREITRRGYLGIPKENGANEKTEAGAKAETAEENSGTPTETTTEKKDAPESVIQPTGSETFNPRHVVRRSDGELFTRTVDGKWEGSDGSVVDDASALNGGYQNVREGVAPNETAEEGPKADVKTESKTAENPAEKPVETTDEKKETVPVAENTPKTTVEASEDGKTDNVTSGETKDPEAVSDAPEKKVEEKPVEEKKIISAEKPKKEESKVVTKNDSSRKIPVNISKSVEDAFDSVSGEFGFDSIGGYVDRLSTSEGVDVLDDNALVEMMEDDYENSYGDTSDIEDVVASSLSEELRGKGNRISQSEFDKEVKKRVSSVRKNVKAAIKRVKKAVADANKPANKKKGNLGLTDKAAEKKEEKKTGTKGLKNKPEKTVDKAHKSIKGAEKVFSDMTEAQRESFDNQDFIDEENAKTIDFISDGSVVFTKEGGAGIRIFTDGTILAIPPSIPEDEISSKTEKASEPEVKEGVLTVVTHTQETKTDNSEAKETVKNVSSDKKKITENSAYGYKVYVESDGSVAVFNENNDQVSLNPLSKTGETEGLSSFDSLYKRFNVQMRYGNTENALNVYENMRAHWNSLPESDKKLSWPKMETARLNSTDMMGMKSISGKPLTYKKVDVSDLVKPEIEVKDGDLKIGVQKKVVEAVRNNPYVVQEQKNAGVRLTEKQLASISETVGDKGEIVDVQIGENDGVKDVVFLELKDGTLKMFDKDGVEIADEEEETRKKSSEDLINASDEEWKAASIGARFKSIADMLAMPPELDFIRSKKKSEQKGYEGLTRDAVLAKAVTDENAKFALLSDYADDLVGLFKDEGLDKNEQDKAFGYILKMLDDEIGKDRVLAKMKERAFDAESAKGLTKDQRKNRIEAFKRDLKERLKEHFRSVESKNDPRRQVIGDEVVSQGVAIDESGKVRTTKRFWYDKPNDILRTERVEVPAETKLVITHDAEKRLAEHKKAIAEFDARIERMAEKALANLERHGDIVKSVGESHTSKPRTKPSKFGLLGNAITADALIKTIARQVVDGMVIAKVVANENAQAEKKAKRIKRLKRANRGYVTELRDGFIITDEDREQANTTAGQILLAKMAVNNSDIESRDIARAIILDELVYKKVRDADVASRVVETLINYFNNDDGTFANFSDKTKFIGKTNKDDNNAREEDLESDETGNRKSSDHKPLTAYIRGIEKRAKNEVERGKISNSSGKVVSLDQKVGGKNDEDGIELSGYLNLYDESGSAADDIIGSYGGDPGINLDRIERGLYVDEDSYNKAVDRLGRIKSSISRSNANLIDAYLGYVNDRIANAKAIVDEMETAAREDKGQSRYLTEKVKTVSDKIGFKKTMLYLKRRLHALYTMRINDDEIVNAISEKTGTPKGFIKARINNLLANLHIAFNGKDGRFSVEQRQDAKESLNDDFSLATGIRYYNLNGILLAMNDAGYDEMAAVVLQTEIHKDQGETSEDIAKRVKRMNIQTVSYSKNGRLVKKVVGQDGVYDGRRVSQVKEDAFRLFGWIDPRAHDITTYRRVAKTRDEDSTRIYLESAGWKKERIDAAKKSYEESKKFAEDRQEKRDKENTKRELVNLISARIRELADANNGDYSAIYSEYPMQETYGAVSRYERGLVEARKRKLESERKQRLETAKNEEERQLLLAEIAKEKESNPELERQYSFYELQDMVREYFANKPENEFASGEIFSSAENHLVDEMIRRDPILAFGESDYRKIKNVGNAGEKIEKSDEQNRRDNALNSIKTAAALAVRSVREEKLREFSKNKDSLRSQYPNQNRVQEAKKKADAEKSLAGAMKLVKDARRLVEKSRPTRKDILGNKIKGEPTLNKYGLTAKQQEKIDSYSTFADGIKKYEDLVKAFKENLPKGLSDKAIQDQVNAYKTYRMIKDAFDLVEAKEAEDAARNEALAKEKAEKETKAVVDGARKKSTEDVVMPQVSQAVSSAGTSLPQNDPTLYKSKQFISSLKRGNKNFDIGAGLTMKPTNRMAEFGVENVKFDPFNVPDEQNSRAINLITSGTKFPTVTCANVLNVIAERDSRRNVILQTAKAVSNDGTVFFDVYTAPKEGLTKKGTYQTAMKPEEYLSEIEPFFNNVERHGSIIIASSPKTDVVNRSVASWWNKEPGTEGFNEVRYKSTDDSFTDDRTIVSPEDTRYMAGQKASLDAHGLGTDYEKIVKKDPILREEAEVIVRDSQKILSTIQKAIEGKAMKDGEILAMVYALADTKANVLLERDASLHVAPAVMSEILNGKDCEQFMDIVAEGIRMAGNRAGASLRALQLAIAASGIRDTKAYMLGKIKERMAKEGITGEVNPGIVKKVEELEKQLADERKKVENQKNLIEKLEKEAAEADAKAEVKYETEYAKKLADAKAEAEKRAKDEYERGLKDGGGKPFTRSAATYRALGLKTDGFDLDGAASAIVRNLGLRHAGNPDISLNEELRAAFDEFYAASGNDINATRKAVNNLFNGQADAAFDVYADEMASKIAKAKSKDGTNKGRKTTVDDNIEKERKVRKAKASKRIKAEDLKAISDYNEYLAKLANAHADNAIRAIGEKASSSERREALGEALRAFYKMAILKKPDVKFDDIIKQIVAEGQRIIRAEITPVMSAEEAAKIDASAALFGREDAVNAVRGSDGYSVKTRQSALTDREMLLKALSLAKQNKFTEAAEVLGLRYMDDAKIVDTLIAQAVRDMNRIGGALAAQFGGKQDEDLIRKFDELRTIVRELKSPELTTEQKIGKYISLASNLKRYHRQRTLVEDLQIRIDRLNRKLEMNDFERKPKQTKPMLDAERAHCAALQVEYKRLQQKCKNAQEQWDLRNASGVFKLIKGVSSVLLDMKGVVGSLDLSSSLRQGGQMSWAHPLLFAKNLKKTIEALKDEKVARNMMLEIYKKPLFKYMERAGVYFADWGDMAMNGNEEEMIMLRHYRQITRFKLAKMGIDSTERAFAMFLNLMRADVFEKLVGYAGIQRLEDVTDQQWRALGKFVNVGSQRGDVEGTGSFEKALRSAIPAANYFMWSPRNFISRLQFLKETLLMPLAFVKYKGNAVYDSYGDSTMKRAFAIETVRYLAGVATMIGFCRLLANLFRDDEEPPPEIVMDPRSSDFMKVKIGNTRLDFLSGLQQIIVLSSRAITKQKTNLRGQTHEIYNTYDLMGRFARSKMSPGVGMMYDLLVSKETFDRQDISWKLYDQLTSDKEKIGGFRYISQSTMVPLIISDIIEQAKNTGIPETTFTGLLTMLGAGVQAFDPYTYKQMKEDFRYFKRAYSEITDPQAQKDFIVRHPMLKRAGSIEAQIKNINRIEKDIKRIEKAGNKPGDWMIDNLEREKKRAINLMAGFKNPFDTGE